MALYRLSKRAEADIRKIAAYTIAQFGVAQARRYRDALNKRLSWIAESPLMYPAVDHIRTGYRRSVFEAHAIYYRVEIDHVLIVRILGHEDPDAAFQG